VFANTVDDLSYEATVLTFIFIFYGLARLTVLLRQQQHVAILALRTTHSRPCVARAHSFKSGFLYNAVPNVAF